jgi:hypothetical protein
MFRRTARTALLAAAAVVGMLALAHRDASAATGDVVNAPFGSAGRTSSVRVNALVGATISAGRMTVVIPPGALRGNATVTVTQPDTAQLVTELHVSPESLNRFVLPVILTMRTGSLLSLDVLQSSRIEWLNPATGQWVPVPGSVANVAGLSLQAPLWHFSTYRATGGKAGW